MASLDGDVDLLTGLVDGALRLADGWCGLDCHTEQNRRTVADAAECTACVVGYLGYLSVCHFKSIVVGAAVRGGSGKSVADLKAFDAADGEHRFGEVCVKLFEYGIANSGRHAGDRTLDDPATGILIFHAFIQICLRCLSSRLVRHADRV